MMNRLRSPSVAAFLVCGLALVSAAPLSAKRPQKELPTPVVVRDLLARPDQYDGQRVLVSGFIRSIEMQQGRRGSEYLVLVLEDARFDDPEPAPSITVVSQDVVRLRRCDRALVQGVYHREGKQAGRPYEHFIEAEAVLQDAPLDSGRVPSGCEEKL